MPVVETTASRRIYNARYHAADALHFSDASQVRGMFVSNGIDWLK